MIYLTCRKYGETFVGALTESKTGVVPVKELGFRADNMNDFIRELNGVQLAMSVLEGQREIKLSDTELVAPIQYPERDVICLGLNYREHAEEAKKADEGYDQLRDEAVYFSKRVDEAVAPNGIINGHFDICTQLDYEVELAVIIGKDANHVKAENAHDYIFGYTILNDVSARNLQLKHKQWYYGKGLDGFTPIGPWIVTPDMLPDDMDLKITCAVNGEMRQQSTTGQLIFNIPYIIEDLSAGMTLQAGTIISTGTPSGVALGMAEPKYLVKGDVVTCEIEGIGCLENTVG